MFISGSFDTNLSTYMDKTLCSLVDLQAGNGIRALFGGYNNSVTVGCISSLDGILILSLNSGIAAFV